MGKMFHVLFTFLICIELDLGNNSRTVMNCSKIDMHVTRFLSPPSIFLSQLKMPPGLDQSLSLEHP